MVLNKKVNSNINRPNWQWLKGFQDNFLLPLFLEIGSSRATTSFQPGLSSYHYHLATKRPRVSYNLHTLVRRSCHSI